MSKQQQQDSPAPTQGGERPGEGGRVGESRWWSWCTARRAQ